MRETKAVKTARLIKSLCGLGFDFAECETLRRAELTLGRWAELECGNSDNYKSYAIERDQETEKPFMVIHPHDGSKSYRYKVADREAGALRRVAAVLAKHTDLWFYHQTDPRGCSLYVGRNADVNGQDLSSVYNRGIAVCV